MLMEKQTVAAKAASAQGVARAVPKLKVEDASVNFGNFIALDGINLEVKDGEFIAIVGPSGCGKSTFLMALDGLTPLSRGKMSIDGVPITKPTQNRAVVFQDACLFPWRTVLNNVTYGLEIAGRPKEERKKIARELIALTGLAGFEDHYPSQLSGGMRQRANIARALATDPEVLLLDEPFSGLDAQTREFMQGELLKIWDEKKKTAIFVTHQIDEAVFLADRVIVFGARPGRILHEWQIPFERPRSLELKHDLAHRKLEDEIWKVLSEGAKQQYEKP